MAQIVQTIVGDQRLQIGGEEFLRTFSFGNYWTKIRVLIRCSINGNSTVVGNYFVTGVCEGTQLAYLSNNTRYYLGLYWVQNQNNTYVNTAQPYYTLASGNTNASILRINGVESNLVSGYGSPPLVAVAWTGFANYIGFDITRNNQAYTIVGWVPVSQAALQIPRSYYSTLFDTENEIGPFSVVNTVWASRTVNAVGGSNQLDTLSIYWSNPNIPLEISDVAVCRYY